MPQRSFRSADLFKDMAQSSLRAWNIRRSRYATVWVAYVLICGSTVFTGAMLGSLNSPPAELQSVQRKAPDIPVARIQFIPDRDNLCHALLFHNDSGRYQDAGRGKCIFPDSLLVWTIHSRAEAFSEAFKASWRGE
jgi:hypothetical protein